jgi:hypothetical protein
MGMKGIFCFPYGGDNYEEVVHDGTVVAVGDKVLLREWDLEVEDRLLVFGADGRLSSIQFGCKVLLAQAAVPVGA